MAWRRVNVGQGRTYFALASALLLVSACSSDSSVSFDPDPDLSGGGSVGAAGTETGATANSAGSSSQSGSGSVGGGMGDGGAPAAGSETGGTDDGGVAGTAAGGMTGSAGTHAAGSAGTGSEAGSSASGGSANGGSGNGGGGNGGSAGNGMAGSSSGFCSQGFFGTHSYAFCGQVESAAAGVAKCQSLGMTVVSIESKAENDYVASKQTSTWLGGSDEAMEGEWRWTSTGVLFWNKKPIDGVYSNFIDGQPSNKDKNGDPENCLALTEKGWNDVGCALGDFKVTCESGGPIFPPPP
jgi:hypothetical protein